MMKTLILIVLLATLTSIWNVQDESAVKRTRFNLEVTSTDGRPVTFNATIFLGRESFLLNEQQTPYFTTMEASGLECLIHASEKVRIVLISQGGRTESILKSAYIKAEKGEKRILGMQEKI